MDQPVIDTVVTVGSYIALNQVQLWRGRDEVSGAEIYVRAAGGPWRILGSADADPNRKWTAIGNSSVAENFTGFQIGIVDYWKPSGNLTYQSYPVFP
jgi:hypothetical protein